MEVSGESASAKRGADAVADDEERARLRTQSRRQARPETRHAIFLGTSGEDEGQAGAQEVSET